jgi:hypothetical protein
MSLPVQPPATIHVRHGTDQYSNTVWYFGEYAIRVDESGPAPVFCLKDCFAANGVQWRGSSKSERVKDQLSRWTKCFAHSSWTGPMLIIRLVFGHLRLMVASQRSRAARSAGDYPRSGPVFRPFFADFAPLCG